MIPLSVPNLAGNEEEYVLECLKTGWISTAGDFVTRFERDFADKLRVSNAVSTVNGTAALHLGLGLIGVQHKDLVVMPNVTFVASANAISYLGADPVLVDIDPTSWQIDLDLLETFLDEDCRFRNDGSVEHKKSGRTVSAIMIVHVQGHMCDIERLLTIANRYQLPVIEDAAEALGASYNGKPAGTFGKVGCFSFNGNKVISTGGGGMLIADTDELLTKAKHRATTAKTDALRYHHDEVGYNYRLVNVLAAIGVAQLENLDRFLDSKKNIARRYEAELRGVGDIRFQRSTEEVDASHWLFTIQTECMEALLRYLNDNGIMSRPFWMPMNQLPMYSEKIYVSEKDVSRDVHSKALSLPCSTSITSEELDSVIGAIKAFY